MLVFIDESGDSGLKFDSGSSRYFVVTGIIFPDRSVAEECDRHISEIRRQLNLSPNKEFHFSKDSDRICEHFLTEVDRFDFKYSAFILNKSELTAPGFEHKESVYKFTSRSVYKFTSRMVCSNLREDLLEATVIFDQCGDKEFRSQLSRYLNRHMNNDGVLRIKRTKMEKSHTNNLLQLADMVCGAVAKSLRSSAKKRAYCRSLIQKHELRVQIWPK